MQNQVLDFWFKELNPKMWWAKSDELDKRIADEFGRLHTQAVAGELFAWREDARGCLAEIIVLDQFSRNVFRDTAKSFAYDGIALVLAQSAIARGMHKSLTETEVGFMFLPFMHSESAAIHDVAVELYKEFGNPYNLEFEYKHKAIIDRFGRYPHRNSILGRQSTAEEIEFLQQPDSSF